VKEKIEIYSNADFRKIVADFLTDKTDGGADDGIVRETFKLIDIVKEKINLGESNIILEDMNVWCGTSDVVDAMLELYDYKWSEKLSKVDDYIHVYVKKEEVDSLFE